MSKFKDQGQPEPEKKADPTKQWERLLEVEQALQQLETKRAYRPYNKDSIFADGYLPFIKE